MPLIFHRPGKPDHAFKTRPLTISRRARRTTMELLRQAAPDPLPDDPGALRICIRPRQIDICTRTAEGEVISYQLELCRSGAYALFLLDYGAASSGAGWMRRS